MKGELNMYGERLKSLRKSKRLSMEELGKRIGLAKSSYAGYETETRVPPIDKLKKLSSLYDVSVDYILGLTDDPDPKKDIKNMREFLDKKQLHWNGRPLTEKELDPIKQLLEMVVKERLPDQIDKNDDNNNNEKNAQ